MHTAYTLTIRRRCPVDGALDTYQVDITANRAVSVELILDAVSKVPPVILQEDLTGFLAEALGVSVRTVGYHSGVRTYCQC